MDTNHFKIGQKAFLMQREPSEASDTFGMLFLCRISKDTAFLVKNKINYLL